LAVAGMLLALSVQAEQITGQACYHYSDNESLIAARNIVLSLAKRDAIESYSVFVASSSLLDNAQLRNDAVSSVGAAVLQDVKIVSNDENLAERKLCVKIQANIDPIQTKQAIGATVAAFKGRPSVENLGLPSNRDLRSVRADRTSEGEKVVVYCLTGYRDRSAGGYASAVLTVRVTSLDDSGIPMIQSKETIFCLDRGDVENKTLKVATRAASVQIDLVESQ